jgi:hypothetical protein
MSNTLKLFIAMWVLSTLALAQHQSQPAAVAGSGGPDATAECDATFKSGTGQNQTTFCVTVNGNIAEFSVNGLEMIAVGQVGEGYGICDGVSDIGYFDYAYEDSGNWRSPSVSQKGDVITVTRETSDGVWQLKQTITNEPATGTGPGSAKVSMALKNLTGVSRFVSVLRFADVDADNDSSNNDFDFTSQTAYGLAPGGLFLGRGLGITNNTFSSSIGQTAFTQPTFNGPDPCNPAGNVASQPFHGDGSVVMFWQYNAIHGETTTLVSTYKPI